ncbi:MAG: AMP-binding protein [Synechococcales cyanobacterium H12SWP_bin.12]|nr:AMP-binding protein [Synechococcales cyanobacterium H12SWP_bin.12]
MATFAALEQALEEGAWLHLQVGQAGGSPADRDPLSPAFDWPLAGGVVLASGGSQGGRSLCLQPWTHLDRSAAACGRWLEGIGLSPEGVILLNPLPLHHISGLMPWWRARLWGAQHVPLPPLLMKDPPSLLATCLDLPGWGKKPAVVSLVPTQLKRLLDHPEGMAWLQHLALVWVGGAGLPAPLAERARKLGVRLAPCYGATETAAMVVAQAPDRFLQGELGCGSPLDDVELHLDRDGVLRVRAQRLALARWRDGRLDPLVDADGWWCTGDAASLTTSGDGALSVQIQGRIDGAIHCGGETVFPEQLSQRLLQQAQEEDLPLEAVLLLPMASEEWGQRLVALVRCRDGWIESEGWASVQRSMRLLTSNWLPSEQPIAWHPCAVLEPSAIGKWERGRWQRWLGSR